MYIPFFDTFLHTVSGFIFAAFGYSVMERVLIRTDENSRRIASLIFAFAFSLALAVLWEMFEWGSTVFLSGDMQEDSIVNSIRSYFLSGSHNNALVLDGITETVIHHSGGTYVIDGYLDLGLQDTLVDMLVCVIGALVFLTLGIIDSGKCDGKLVTLFTPSLSYGSISSGETSEKSSI